MLFSLSNINPSKWLGMGGKSLLILALLTAILLPAAQPVAADTGIPAFTIIDVVIDTSVTIQTSNFPADETFTVLMGPIGTLGIDGIKVATTETGTGGTIEATYDIPEELKGSEMIAIRLESESGYYSYNWFFNDDDSVVEEVVSEEETEAEATATPAATKVAETESTEAEYTGIPSFSIVEVGGGTSVKINTNNFPADMEFSVLMGPYGTRAVSGVEVEKTNSGTGGTFEKTYTIPESLKDSGIIAIRMDSADGFYYCYNWFYNTSMPVPVTEEVTAEATPEAATTEETETVAESGYTGVPSFQITAVAGDVSVQILTENLPADDTFTVRMGVFGSRALGGTEVGTIETGEGGAVEKSFNIPEDLAGANLIAIRMESESGYYAYNWFFNTTSPVAEAEYSGVPTFSIVSVVKNTTVTILTDSFPSNLEFTVLMGPIGSKAIDGLEVSTAQSGEGGAFELTFDIPADFVDYSAIAIRLDSSDGIYNSYNWFFNNQ